MAKKVVAIIVIILFLSLVTIIQVRQQTGIEVSPVDIEINGRIIKGNLAIPEGLGPQDKRPGIVVFHGFSASKEMMRPFLEGYAKTGFVTIAIDQQGHGLTTVPRSDISDGVEDAIEIVEYLRSLSQVDPAQIGLIGHSMGGGVAIRTAIDLGDIAATVVIGNSLSSIPATVNASFPQNVLMAVGSYDELFSVSQAERAMKQLTELSTIEYDVVYGDHSLGTARQLLVAPTNHIFEVLNFKIVKASLEWMVDALADDSLDDPPNPLNFYIDQLLSLVAGVLYFGFLATMMMLRPGNFDSQSSEKKWLSHGILTFGIFLAGYPLASLFSVSFLGLFVGWYVLGSLFYGLMIYRRKQKGEDVSLSSTYSEVVFVFVFIILLIVCAQILLYNLTWDFRYVIPVISKLNFQRVDIFLILFFPGWIYFTFDYKRLGGTNNSLLEYIKDFAGRAWTFAIFLAIYYFVLIVFGQTVLPGLVGFLAFFLVGFVPAMFLISMLTTVGHRYNFSPISIGMMCSTVVAWILAATLPFVG